mmetsp:Transcript_24774/g.76514  ORF Transcript_24774/g.76514 Transcript_24774/m.76514 type:complete len:273 (-) Transcript_24774:622-1440(-)
MSASCPAASSTRTTSDRRFRNIGAKVPASTAPSRGFVVSGRVLSALSYAITSSLKVDQSPAACTSARRRSSGDAMTRFTAAPPPKKRRRPPVLAAGILTPSTSVQCGSRERASTRCGGAGGVRSGKRCSRCSVWSAPVSAPVSAVAQSLCRSRRLCLGQPRSLMRNTARRSQSARALAVFGPGIFWDCSGSEDSTSSNARDVAAVRKTVLSARSSTPWAHSERRKDRSDAGSARATASSKRHSVKHTHSRFGHALSAAASVAGDTVACKVAP